MIKKTVLFLICTWGLAIAGCTDAALEGMPAPPPPIADNKLAISGEVCTEDPEELVFPLRVIFLVDCSDSMSVSLNFRIRKFSYSFPFWQAYATTC